MLFHEGAGYTTAKKINIRNSTELPRRNHYQVLLEPDAVSACVHKESSLLPMRARPVLSCPVQPTGHQLGLAIYI